MDAALALLLFAIVGAAVVIITGSRSAWLGLAGASTVTAFAWLVAHRHSLADLVTDRRIRAGVAVIGTVLIVGAIVLGPMVLDRLSGAR